MRKKSPTGIRWVTFHLSDLGDRSDMGVHALVPVQEALNINNIALNQLTNGGVNCGVGTGQVNFHAEAVLSAVLLQGHIDVITGLAVLVLDSLNGHALESNQLVLMSDQLLGSQQVGHIQSFSNEGIAALNELEGAVHDFHFACPLTLVTGDADLGAGNQLGSVFPEQASSYRK